MFQFNRGQPAAASSADEIIAAIRGTPVVADALSAAAARKVAARQALVDQLAQMEDAAMRAFPIRAAKVDAAIAAQKRAQEAALAAGRALDLASIERSSAAFAHTRLREQIEGALREGADNAAIDAFREWAMDEIDQARREPISRHQTSTKAPKTEVATITTTSNHTSIHARIAALRAALDAAERLRLKPDQAVVSAALDELRAGLPVIADETTVTSATPPAPVGLWGIRDRVAADQPMKGKK